MVSEVTTSARDFLSLAEREASRYGNESMVFLRELLQNARDADANKVVIDVSTADNQEMISVTDDGRGMAMDHARRFLLTLYASSKRRTTDVAGRFGVGFWSILRFRPTEITIRSRVKDEPEGWQIIFDSALNVVDHRSCPMARGTSVVLKRAAQTDDLEESVWELIRRDSRHLRRRDDPDALMDVTVNGRRATEPMEPEEPGLSFRRSGIRGVVSLGSAPQVTLLAHGLKVCSAAFVDDLVLRPGRRSPKAHRLPASGLSPQVVVDSDRLAVLMDRGDVAQDRHLVRVARVIRSEIRRLCEMELERLAPRSLSRRLSDAVVRYWTKVGVGILVLAGLVVGSWGALELAPKFFPTPTIEVPGGRTSEIEPYFDRSANYGGPVNDSIDGVGISPALKYRPTDMQLYLAAFRIYGIDDAGRPLRSELPLRLAEDIGSVGGESIEFELNYQATARLIRVPVPTGYSVDRSSVRINGKITDLWMTQDDEPAVQLAGEGHGQISYRTTEGPEVGRGIERWPIVPGSVRRMASDLRSLPPQQRIGQAINLVRSSLQDLGSNDDSTLDDVAVNGFMARVFQDGWGDCDVVNTVLAAVLSESGLSSRLAIGWVGVGGVPVAGLHAWVEVDLGGGRWMPADATLPRLSELSASPDSNREPIKAPVASAVQPRSGGAPLTSAMWWGLFAAILAGTGAMVGMRIRVRRHYLLPADPDPGPLVESLVRDRERWPGYKRAIRRPLVPGQGQDNYSLAAIEKAASLSRLFVAGSQNTWNGRIEDRGGLIIDGKTRAGRVAAAASGALDLDRWQPIWEQSGPSRLCREIQEALRGAGLFIEIQNGADVPGGTMGLSVGGGCHGWVVIDEHHFDWLRCRELIQSQHNEAIFRAADLVIAALPVAGPRVKQALAELARSTLVAVKRPDQVAT